jgi:glycosyltransferase involved in cell wall biosynthesis
MSNRGLSSSTNDKIGILVCIPTYNAEATIRQAVSNCKKYADLVLVINDGSSDNSEKIAKDAGAEVITHKKNRGYGGAIKTGLKEGLRRHAKITITFDADLQHDAEDIPKIIEPILSDKADIVIGSRFLENDSNVKPYRKFGIKVITKMVSSFSGNNIQDAESGLRAYSLDALKQIVPSLETEGMGMSAEILLKAAVNKLKIVEVPRKEMYPEGIATSSKNPLRHGFSVVFTILKLIVETKPLKAFGIPAVLFFIAAAISTAYVVDFYNNFSRLPLGLTVFTVLLVSVGFFFILAAIIVYVLSRISNKINFAMQND